MLELLFVSFFHDTVENALGSTIRSAGYIPIPQPRFRLWDLDLLACLRALKVLSDASAEESADQNSCGRGQGLLFSDGALLLKLDYASRANDYWELKVSQGILAQTLGLPAGTMIMLSPWLIPKSSSRDWCFGSADELMALLELLKPELHRHLEESSLESMRRQLHAQYNELLDYHRSQASENAQRKRLQKALDDGTVAEVRSCAAVPSLLNSSDAYGNTVLHNAILYRESQTPGNAERVAVLCAAGANPNLPNHDGMTALHCAAQMQDVGLASCLLNHGANPLLLDAHGRSAIDHCLIKYGASPALPFVFPGRSANVLGPQIWVDSSLLRLLLNASRECSPGGLPDKLSLQLKIAKWFDPHSATDVIHCIREYYPAF